EAYYLPGPDGTFAPTLATESPWSTDAQHGGPPTALLGHVMRARHPAEAMRIARITVEFLGPVPRVPLTVTTAIIRDGRRIRLLAGRRRPRVDPGHAERCLRPAGLGRPAAPGLPPPVTTAGNPVAPEHRPDGQSSP